MTHRPSLEAVDRMLQDLNQSVLLIGETAVTFIKYFEKSLT